MHSLIASKGNKANKTTTTEHADMVTWGDRTLLLALATVLVALPTPTR